MQSSSAVMNSSLTTVSLTLSLVTATGSSRTDGTLVLPLSTSSVILLCGTSSPSASATAISAADLRLLVGGLVDRHELLAGDDSLHAGDGGVLAGARPFFRVDAGRFHRGDRAGGRFVVGSVDAFEPVFAECGDRLLHLVLGVRRRPFGRVVFLGDFDPGGFEPFVRAFLEERGVAVGGVAVDLHDRALGATVFFQFFRQRFGLQFADLDVVEGDVVVDFGVFDQPVVAEDRDVLRFRLFDDRRGRFGVDRVERPSLRHPGSAPLPPGSAVWRRRRSRCCRGFRSQRIQLRRFLRIRGGRALRSAAFRSREAGRRSWPHRRRRLRRNPATRRRAPTARRARTETRFQADRDMSSSLFALPSTRSPRISLSKVAPVEDRRHLIASAANRLRGDRLAPPARALRLRWLGRLDQLGEEAAGVGGL